VVDSIHISIHVIIITVIVTVIISSVMWAIFAIVAIILLVLKIFGKILNEWLQSNEGTTPYKRGEGKERLLKSIKEFPVFEMFEAIVKFSRFRYDIG